MLCLDVQVMRELQAQRGDHPRGISRTVVLGEMLYNTYHYYAQFSQKIQEALEALREPIAKQLRDHVHLAKWEDHRYHKPSICLG